MKQLFISTFLFCLVHTAFSQDSTAFQVLNNHATLPDQYVLVPTPPGSNLLYTSSYSIESWVFIPSSASSNLIHIISTEYSTQSGFILRVDFGRIKLFVNGNGGYNSLGGTDALTYGQWNHIAATYDVSIGEIKLYLNGVLDKTGSFGSPIPALNTNSNIYIGASGNDQSISEQITVDDVRIWSGVRTLTEIESKMDKCLTGSEPNLLAYYDFENETGNSVTDISGNGNTGTIVGYDASNDNYIDGAFSCSTLAVGTTDQLESSIFPNPTSGKIKVISELPIQKIQLFDVYGNFVKETTSHSFDIVNQPNGVYFIHLVTDGGTTISKVVKS